jgi:hypothetical protein
MTGVRSCTGAISSFAEVVMMVCSAATGRLQDPSIRPRSPRRPHASVGEVEGEGLLVLRVELLPLVEAGGGDQAVAFLEGLAVSGGLRHGLGAGVDRGGALKSARIW